MDVREKLVELRKEAAHYAICTCSAFQHCEDCPYRKYGTDCRDNIEMDCLIKKGVTVQERGHWEDDHGDYVCSCCRTVFTDDLVWIVRSESDEPNYCPHCGAKMIPQPPKGE